MKLNRTVVALTVVALAVPAGVSAKGPDAPAKGKAKSEKVSKGKKKGKAHGKAKPRMFVFKGTWAGEGSVEVTGGNARVRKSGFKGTTVAFDLSGAKLRVADTSGDGQVGVEDVVLGDEVLVKAKLPRDTAAGPGPFVALKLVDQTNPAAEEVEAPEVEEAAPAG